MRFFLDIDARQAQGLAPEVAGIVRWAGRESVKDAAEAFKLQVRQQITRGFASARRTGAGVARVANAVRSRLYDEGDSAVVYSKFGRGRGAAFQDYLLPHVTGAMLKPSFRRFLLIPLVKRRTIDRYADRQIIPLGGGRFLLVANRRGKGAGIALAILTPSVRLRARFDFRTPARATGDLFERLFLARLQSRGLA